MATTLRTFMTIEDERAFLRFLERHRLLLYPERIPPDWREVPVEANCLDGRDDEAVYLAAPELGPITVDKVKRGPDRGALRIDEVRSPVIFFSRSKEEREGELSCGQLWAELDVTPQTGRRTNAPDRFRQLVVEVEGFIKRTFRKGEPSGYWVGPHAARRHKEGLVLRGVKPGYPEVRPFR